MEPKPDCRGQARKEKTSVLKETPKQDVIEVI
jgi:hypothetical protein